MDHFKFQQEIVKRLLAEFREGHAQPGRRPLLRTVRLTARHFIEYIPEKKRLRCSICTGMKSRFSGSRVRTWCADCGVGLSLCKIVRSSVILLLPLFRKYRTTLMYEE